MLNDIKKSKEYGWECFLAQLACKHNIPLTEMEHKKTTQGKLIIFVLLTDFFFLISNGKFSVVQSFNPRYIHTTSHELYTTNLGCIQIGNT